MWKDPYTLTVALGKSYEAKGELYSDDGDSFSHEQGEFIWRGLEFVPKGGKGVAGTLRSRDLVKERGALAAGLKADGAAEGYDAEKNAWAKTIGRDGEKVKVERVVVLGLKASPKKVRVAGGKEVEFEWTKGVEAGRKGGKEGRASELVIKNPGVLVVEDWEIVLE